MVEMTIDTVEETCTFAWFVLDAATTTGKVNATVINNPPPPTHLSSSVLGGGLGSAAGPGGPGSPPSGGSLSMQIAAEGGNAADDAVIQAAKAAFGVPVPEPKTAGKRKVKGAAVATALAALGGEAGMGTGKAGSEAAAGTQKGKGDKTGATSVIRSPARMEVILQGVTGVSFTGITALLVPTETAVDDAMADGIISRKYTNKRDRSASLDTIAEGAGGTGALRHLGMVDSRGAASGGMQTKVQPLPKMGDCVDLCPQNFGDWEKVPKMR
ncbi:hypothetical protein B484DRAFT_434504 [Ochromonadaceae sp. CCMP2298]|nr:hypothetical protein B484DRAFT_434504 [Ochromonadaceae sp. CCMP2298]